MAAAVDCSCHGILRNWAARLRWARKGLLMPLFRSHRDELLGNLTRKMRLLLPADPGQEQMLDAVRQFSPAADVASGGRICVDGSIYLRSPIRIEAELAAAAQLPPKLRSAISWTGSGRNQPGVAVRAGAGAR